MTTVKPKVHVILSKISILPPRRLLQPQVHNANSIHFYSWFYSSGFNQVMDNPENFERVPLVAKVCPKCVDGDLSIGVPVTSTTKTILQYKSWCSVAKCHKCGFLWYVCRECTTIRSVLDTTKKLNKHANKHHSQGIAWNANLTMTDLQKRNRRRNVATRASLSHATGAIEYEVARTNLKIESMQQDQLMEDSIISSNDTYQADNDDQSTNTPSRLYGGVPTVVLECAFSRQESKDYFANNHHYRNGPAYLISRSFYENHTNPEDINKDDLDMCLKLALMIKTFTICQSEMLGEFLSLLFARVDAMEDQWQGKVNEMEVRPCNDGFCKNCVCKSCIDKLTNKRPKSPFEERIRLPPLLYHETIWKSDKKF
jgi:hypothetical protein